MRALSIRQPFAELILRGIKTVEYRSRPTRIIGERFYLYASQSPLKVTLPNGKTPGRAWSHDLSTPDAPPPWLVELAEGLRLFEGTELPRGVIVGSAVVEKVTQRESDGIYGWHLGGVERATELQRPKRHPQPTWFWPF